MKFDLRDLRVVYINTDRKKVRNKRMYQMLDAMGFKDFKRFKGINGKTLNLTGINSPYYIDKKTDEFRRHNAGNSGCCASHSKVLEQTILNDGLPVLILEDDAELIGIDDYFNFIHEIPDNTSAYYLGGGSNNYTQARSLNDNVNCMYIQGVYTNHAILYLDPYYAAWYHHMINDIVYLTESDRWGTLYFDVITAWKLQPYFRICGSRYQQFWQYSYENIRRCTKHPYTEQYWTWFNWDEQLKIWGNYHNSLINI